MIWLLVFYSGKVSASRRLSEGEVVAILNAPFVNSVFLDCVVLIGEDVPEDVKVVKGIGGATSWLHPAQIDMWRSDIHDLVRELPDEFWSETGGEFRQAYLDRHGNRWAAMDVDVERLIHLAIACSYAEYFLPYEQWHGYPYFRLLQT